MFKRISRSLALAAVILSLIALPAFAVGQSEAAVEEQTIVWNDVHSAASGEAMREIAALFEERNPGYKVELNISEHESAKTQVRLWVTADKGPDVIGWQSGNYRFHQFTRAGLVHEITDLWESNNFDNLLNIPRESVSVDGKVYAVTTYRCAGYGFFYNKEVWAEHGYEEPATWDEFIALGEQMKEDGLTPLAVGTRQHAWTTGAWFLFQLQD